MPLFNSDKIAKLISEMRKAFERLQILSSSEKNKFLENLDRVDSAKYNFIVAIESAIGICNHKMASGYRRITEMLFRFCLNKVLLILNL